MLKKLALLLSLLAPGVCFGQGVIVPPQTALKSVNGVTMPIANATITVCAVSTGGLPCSPALANALFVDAALTVPLSNPFTADNNGNYNFAIAPGNYTVTVTAQGFSGYSYQVSAGNGTAGSSVTLQTNGVNNSVQSLLNLVPGSGIGIANSGGNDTFTNNGVVSFNARTGAVVPVTNDYTWAQIGAGSNLNAQTMGTGGSMTPLNVGQVIGSQYILSPGIIAPTGTANNNSGSIASNHGIQIAVTYNTAAGSNLPSIQINVGTGSSCGTGCNVVVTAPTLASGYTSYSVYACDLNAGGPCTTPQLLAGCTNISGNCTISSSPTANTTSLPTLNTAWTQPPNNQAQSPTVPVPQGWVPTLWRTAVDGNNYPILGLDPSTCSPLVSPCGVPMWVDRLFINDTGVNIASACATTACFGNIKNNPFSIAHTVGNGTTATNGNDDRAMGWRSSTLTTMTGANNPRVMGIYGEMYLNGTPTGLTGAGPDAGFIGIRTTMVDNRTGGNLSASPIVGHDVFISGQALGGGYTSCNPCAAGMRSIVSTNATGGLNVAGMYSQAGIASSGSGWGMAYMAHYGAAGSGNAAFDADTSWVSGANNYGILQESSGLANLFGGPIYLPSILSDATTIGVTGSLGITGAVTTTQLSGTSFGVACGTSGSTAFQGVVIAHDSNGANFSSGAINFNNCASDITATNFLRLSSYFVAGATSYDFYFTNASTGTCNGGACTLGKIAALSCTPAYGVDTRQPKCTFTYTGTAGDGSSAPTANTTGGIGTAGDISFTTGKGQHIDMQAANNDLGGVATCAASTVTVTFTRAYTSTPVIVVSDETAAGGARVSAKSASSFTITCTGATDVVDYIVVGNPN